MADNETNYQSRLDFVQGLLRDRLHQGRGAKVLPIQYDPESPFKYNNHVYRITHSSPVQDDQVPEQPGTKAIPNGTNEFIVRLANPDAEGMSPRTRIENEVALISLASKALRHIWPHVVPEVYGWGSAANSAQGWILQELMPGEPLDEAFSSMDLSQEKGMFGQMVQLLKGLQEYKLPGTIEGFGGVTFAQDGTIVSAAMTSVGEGPWPSYQASFESRLQIALRKADANEYIKGWHANGIRERLEAFRRNVPEQFTSLESAEDKCIIHADFTTNNILFDPSSHRITGLIDYDFSCILHPSYEFLRSFDGAGGQFRGWLGDEDSEAEALGRAKLHGFPSPLPDSSTDESGTLSVDWHLSKAWEDEMERLDVKRPRTIGGIDKVADVDTMLRSILPWRLSNSDILRLQSEKVIMKCRAENETLLGGLLDRLGF